VEKNFPPKKSLGPNWERKYPTKGGNIGKNIPRKTAKSLSYMGFCTKPFGASFPPKVPPRRGNVGSLHPKKAPQKEGFKIGNKPFVDATGNNPGVGEKRNFLE